MLVRGCGGGGPTFIISMPNVTCLYPREGYCHAFVAGPRGAVLDVLFPPYNDDGGRLRSDDCQLTSGISKRVHYPPSSCCVVSKFPGNLSNLRPLSSHDVTTSSQAWFHVYSHKTAICSRRTQGAAVAHLPDGVPSSIRRSRIRRAKKKLHKQQCLLREIVPSLDILNPTVSIEDIDKEYWIW